MNDTDMTDTDKLITEAWAAAKDLRGRIAAAIAAIEGGKG